ncbi:MAG TPA: hypothetical protein VFZ61_03200 [Polyangiales bacterium]
MSALRGALAGLLMLTACAERTAPIPGGATQTTSPGGAPERDAAVEAAPSPPPAAAPRAPRPAGRVAIKEASGAGEEAMTGARLALPRAFELRAKTSQLTLDFEHGARVHISGPARVLADEAEQDLLLCGEGTLSVDLAPSAPTPQSGFSLLTPSGLLTLVRGGRYALRVDPGGTTHGLVVSGSATLRTAAAAADQEAALLTAGDSFRLAPDGGLKRTRRAPETLAQAEAAVQALPAARKGERLDLARLDRTLQTATVEATTLAARQAAIMAEHRALVRARDGGTERLAELQRELAQHAEQLARARARLRLALGQRAAAAQTAALGGDDVPSAEARALLTP